MEQIIPYGEYVLLEPIQDTQSESGIILPDSVKGQVSRATVVAVGSEATFCCNTEEAVQAGDKVIYQPGNDLKLKMGDKEVILVKEERIVAKYL